MRAVGQYRTEMPWHTALTVLTVARLPRLKDFQYPAGVRARRSRPERTARCIFLARVCVSTVSIGGPGVRLQKRRRVKDI
jgi:hypothetical protein